MTLLSNLVSYWKLDEASGNALDAHGSNTLADNNTVTAAAGKVNGARAFEFSNIEFLSHADNADLRTGDVDFCVNLWMNPESLPSFPVLAAKGWGTSGTKEWVLYYDGADLIFAVTPDGTTEATAQTVHLSVSLSTGSWYMVTAWHDAVNDLLGLAVDAGTPSTKAYAGGVFGGAGDFWVGASPNQSLCWDGLIDEFGFWKRVLTSGERTQLYNAGAGFSYDSFGGGGGSAAGADALHHYGEHVMRGAA